MSRSLETSPSLLVRIRDMEDVAAWNQFVEIASKHTGSAVASNVVKIATVFAVLGAIGFALPTLLRRLNSADSPSGPGSNSIVSLAESEGSTRDFAIVDSTETFASLPEAIQATSSGAIIEIAGNGPYDVLPLTLSADLTIRAASGYRPVLRIVQGRSGIVTMNDLRLEGIHIQAEKDPTYFVRNPIVTSVVKSRDSKLDIIDCELEGTELGAVTCEGGVLPN